MSEKANLKIVRSSGELIEQHLDFCRDTWGHVHDSYIL